MSETMTTNIALPPKVPVQQFRPVQKNIPPLKEQREKILNAVRQSVEKSKLTPPLPADKLRVVAGDILNHLNFDDIYIEYTGILISNELWREELAKIPYERRLLLLPKCLRLESSCPAPFDEFGLLCKQCGLCTIQDLQNEAEKLGYAVLVAEGSAIVMNIIQTGKIEAIVGVSCISVLERAFPFMEAAAIPGIAIPLLQNDCKDTTVDIEWVWDVIHLHSQDRSRRMDLDAIKRDTQQKFHLEVIEEQFGKSDHIVDKMSRQWLCDEGKRWRPFLTVAVAKSLQEDQQDHLDDSLIKCALAVECFHKASLIHDDIEDDDDERYGKETLHKSAGLAQAINIGDSLIGEGYRLISNTTLSPDIKAELLKVAAESHCQLSRGQGLELELRKKTGPVRPEVLLNLFKDKTAPAFDVAIQFGLLYHGIDRPLLDLMKQFSTSLGVAYQIHDDLNDINSGAGGDIRRDRPSLALALTWEKTDEEQKKVIEKWWAGEIENSVITQMIKSSGAIEQMIEWREAWKQQALNTLNEIGNVSLKGVLRRVVARIFNDITIKGWCHDDVAEDEKHLIQSERTAR